jgi:hypothetical protein
MSGVTHGPISMITLILFLIISFGMSMLQLYNVYFQMTTNKKSETDFVSSGDVNKGKKDTNKSIQPNTIVNPVD